LPVAPVTALPDKYILFVGSRTGRKNFRFFIRAIAPVLKRHEEVRLLCTGLFNRWETDHLESLGVSGSCIDMEADDGLLLYLYRRALCLVYPTLYEGFGLPVLEAMANGCPTLTADSGAIREVGGDAVEYMDPYDADSIAGSLEAMIEQPERRRRLSELGTARAGIFLRQRMMKDLYDEFARAAGICR
jgi:glycosyltransferase involved in cell wall biosynthesis